VKKPGEGISSGMQSIEIAQSIKNVEWYSVYLFWSLWNVEEFSAAEKKIDVKNVWNDKMTKCFSNNLSRFFGILLRKNIFFLEDNSIYYMFILLMFCSFHLMKYVMQI